MIKTELFCQNQFPILLDHLLTQMPHWFGKFVILFFSCYKLPQRDAHNYALQHSPAAAGS